MNIVTALVILALVVLLSGHQSLAGKSVAKAAVLIPQRPSPIPANNYYRGKYHRMNRFMRFGRDVSRQAAFQDQSQPSFYVHDQDLMKNAKLGINDFYFA